MQPQKNHLLNESITIVGFDLLGNIGVPAFSLITLKPVNKITLFDNDFHLLFYL